MGKRIGAAMGSFISNHPARFLVLSVVATMVAVCSVDVPSPLFLPKWVTDTRIPVGEFSWLDNRRIFVWKPQDSRQQGSVGGEAKYVLWTDGPNGGTVSPVNDIKATIGPDFCDGQGSTGQKRGGDEATKDGFVFNKFVCADTPIPASAKGRYVFPLRPGHGVFSTPMGKCGTDCETDYWKKPYRWHADDGSGRVVKLPYDKDTLSLSTGHIKYAPFVDAYLAQEDRYEKGVECQFAWWIRPGPAFENFCAARRGYGYETFPTKLGIVTVEQVPSYHVGSTSDNGVYLSANNRFLTLIPGYSFGLRVSPDGCRIAVGHSRRQSSKKANTLFVFDLCVHKDTILNTLGKLIDIR
ncbi:MAG: hypothetical protein HQ513_10835 [Rhodospirillales bacterium]|nr:hypothetical protein [Rhodospirillales bacterium]